MDTDQPGEPVVDDEMDGAVEDASERIRAHLATLGVPAWFDDHRAHGSSADAILADAIQRVIAEPADETLAEFEAIVNLLGTDPANAVAIRDALDSDAVTGIVRVVDVR